MVEIRINDNSNAANEKQTEDPNKETVIITQPSKQLAKKETVIITSQKRIPPKKETIVIKKKTKRTRKPGIKKETIIIKEGTKRVKSSQKSSKTVKDMVAVMKANQQLVDEMIKVNTGIMENVVRLSSSVASLTEKMNAFLAKERREELPSTVKDEMEEKLDQMERKLNNIITSLSPHQ